MQVKNWCHSMDLNLPTLSYNNVIIIGVLPCSGDNVLINHFILLYKLVLFNSRDKNIIPTLILFKSKIKEIETIEYKIATKQGKTFKHIKNIWTIKNNVLIIVL